MARTVGTPSASMIPVPAPAVNCTGMPSGWICAAATASSGFSPDSPEKRVLPKASTTARNTGPT
jgi:hypothetical protein